jgi:hypothetical protein
MGAFSNNKKVNSLRRDQLEELESLRLHIDSAINKIKTKDTYFINHTYAVILQCANELVKLETFLKIEEQK